MAQRNKGKQEKKVVNATVIDQAILTKAVKDYLNEHKIIPKESINFGKIKVLSLSFLNIWKIQYLESLVRLEKLQLDNNIIEKVENLDHLGNLKWLDLSFNHIKQIEGLERLVNLTDLSLYNNKITELDGLQNCPKLNIFSIGNNSIKSFEEIIAYFGRGSQKKTRFKYLQVLNVFGNPFTMKDGVKDQEYEYHLVSHLPNLRYLDYIFIDEKRRKQIRQIDNKFKTEDQAKFLQELQIEEQKQKQLQEQKRKKESAKMHLLDGYSEDIIKIEDLQKIQKMRGLQEEMAKFSVKVKELVEPMQKRIKQENEKKLEQIRKSEQKMLLRQKQAESKTAQAISEFEAQKKTYDKIFEAKYIHKNWKDEAINLKTRITELKDKLLNIQIELVEDSEALFKKQIIPGIDQQNKKIQNIMSQEQKDEKSQESGFFKKIEDQIKQFGIQLEKISKEEIQRYINMQNAGETEQEYSSDPELNGILQNRETIPGIISTIKQLLLQKKTKKESEIQSELCNKFKQNYVKQFGERQYQRNRKNVKNINQKIQKLYRQVQRVLEDDEYD